MDDGPKQDCFYLSGLCGCGGTARTARVTARPPAAGAGGVSS